MLSSQICISKMNKTTKAERIKKKKKNPMNAMKGKLEGKKKEKNC